MSYVPLYKNQYEKRSSLLHDVSASTNRQFEEDQTFVPPPSLSYYSIEVLNSKGKPTKRSPITGKYSEDFADRQSELKKKLSVTYGHTTTASTQNSFNTHNSDDIMDEKSGSTSKSTTSTDNKLKRKRKYGKLLGEPKRASEINILEDDPIPIDEELIKKNVEERKEQRRIELESSKNDSVENQFKTENFEAIIKTPLQSPFQENRKPLSNISPNIFRKPLAPVKIPQKSSYDKHEPPEPQAKYEPPVPKFQPNTTDEDSKKKFVVNGKEYEKMELLGRGGSSKVYRIKASNGHQYALKKVMLNQFEDIDGFKGEIALLKKLRNYKRVVKLYDSEVTKSSLYLIMEKGDIDLAMLFQNRLSMNLPLDLQFVRYHISEMFKCVKDVHDAGIVHSDLKPANFLMVRGILKIIDFGIANAVPDHTSNIYRESQIGTPNYMAPEALEEANLVELRNTTWKVGRPSDIWSCGCILYQFIYGRPPYASLAGTKRILAIMNPQYKIQYPPHGIGNVLVPQSAIRLIQNCLCRDPDDRWTVEQCLESEFFNPKVVDENIISKFVHESVNFGFNKRKAGEGITTEAYDSMVNNIIEQIRAYNC
ncbi:MPS1 [Candida pseudojiufengensis]|uniref:MPS1 n=1 Tax=Candida pseudojiufengensis TaxID=497109 RepID=UPI002224FC2D|nr:MPS1 [Candida pseudojiufengensis]KAI5961883.1 MPS1 [Candida pseudojiufengensis]